MRNSQRLLILILLLGGVLPLFGNSQAAALALDQATSTLSTLRTATVTTTSTSHLTQTKTASTTVATTTSYIPLTRTQAVLTISTTTSYINRTRFTTSTSFLNSTRSTTATSTVSRTSTATATTTGATTTNYVNQTGTTTVPTTVATTTNYVNQTKTTTAPTTVATTTNYISQTKTTTSTTSLNLTRTATATSLLNQTKTTTVPTTIATTTNYVNQTSTTNPTTITTTTAYVSQTATTSIPTTITTRTNYVNQTATANSSTTTTTSVNTTKTVTATSTITTSTTSTQSTVPSTQPTGLLIPLFIYPTTTSTWSSIAALPAAYPNVPVIAIVNPANGVGASKDLNYVAAINSLKSSGVITIGYITTGYGSIPLQSVKTSIDLWKSYYGVTGIFLDAMAYTPGSESYYQSIESYAKGTDGMNIVIGNPGTETIASYIGNGGVDNIGFYENSGTPTIAYLSSPFHTSYPKTQWSFICYGVASLNDTFITQASQYVSYLYVASGAFPNPWGTLPSYLNQMAADLARVNPPALSIKASPTNIASNANPNRINDNHQLDFGCETKCVPNFSISFPSFNSQNVLIVVGHALRLQTPINIMLRNESGEFITHQN